MLETVFSFVIELCGWLIDAALWALEVVGAYFYSGKPGATLVRDLVIAILIAALSSLFVNVLWAILDRSKRRRILKPMRLLMVDAAAEANRSVFDFLVDFNDVKRKRLKTRIRGLQEGLAKLRGPLSPAVVSSLEFFAQSEQIALAKFVGSLDAKHLSTTSTKQEVANWLTTVQDSFRGLLNAMKGDDERSRLSQGAWSEAEFEELQSEFLARFFTDQTSETPPVRLSQAA